jgi:hypothetical protein
VPPDHLVDPEPGQRRAVPGREDRAGRQGVAGFFGK